MTATIPRSANAAAPLRVAVYVPTLAGGGAERAMLALAGALLDAGHAVDLLLNRRCGAYVDRIPDGARVVVLDRGTKIRARAALLRTHPLDSVRLLRPVLLAIKPIMGLRHLYGLSAYLARERPHVIISAMFYANLLSIWARRIADVDVPVIVTEHNTISRRIAHGMQQRHRARWRYLAPLIGRVYPRANAIVSVSDGVADDLALTCGLPRSRVTTIYNPVVSPDMARRAADDCDHPWFGPGQPPVILSAGRLEAQKDFASLLEAFAQLRQRTGARLIILGDGAQRRELAARADAFGIADDVDFVGWVANPHAYMARARLFVLSSRWEGLGNVLIEALACGCPVVATDCPCGPREILRDGRYGTLVPVGNPAALADAIAQALVAPVDRLRLRRRAADFDIETSARRYRHLIDAVSSHPARASSGSRDPLDADTGV